MAKSNKTVESFLPMRAMGLGSIGAMVSVVVLTIVGELVPSVKAFLTQLTGHHWITKGFAALAIFVLIGGIVALFQRSPESEEESALWAWIASGTALIGVVVVFLFFIGHFVTTP
jgi:MFS family permease